LLLSSFVKSKLNSSWIKESFNSSTSFFRSFRISESSALLDFDNKLYKSSKLLYVLIKLLYIVIFSFNLEIFLLISIDSLEFVILDKFVIKSL
jgi:hypothetical protein